MAETLTVTRLGLHGRLKATMASTNPCESMFDIVRATQRNVKPGETVRCACAGRPPACSRPSASSAPSGVPMLLAALRREVNPT